MLGLRKKIVFPDLDDDGVFALVVIALGQQLVLHLGRTAAKAHLVQLREVVAQAHLHTGLAVDEKVHQLHDALGALVKDEGARIAATQLFEEFSSLGVLPREETVEEKA